MSERLRWAARTAFDTYDSVERQLEGWKRRPRPDIEDKRREYEERGYVRFPRFFTEQEMTDVVAAIQSPASRDSLDTNLTKGTLQFYANLFRVNPAIRQFVSQPRIVDLLVQMCGPDLFIRWDQAVAKGPSATTFPWHQDNAYNGFTHEHFQLWIALSEMTPDNGGLWLVPSRHRKLLPHDRVDCHMVYRGEPKNPEFITAEKGDVVLFSSLTLHTTRPNVTDQVRWAYVVEYMRSTDYDAGISGPYWQVARNGRRDPRFVDRLPGTINPLNRLRAWSEEPMLQELLGKAH
jgi:ectoine hydroxylase-related dioxygenase (phytanoyl-CoA dioxygenase family)